MPGEVISVACDGGHHFVKAPQRRIALLAGLGVAGDAHCGATVRHRSRLTKTPNAANLRQVHLIHAELFAELADAGFAVRPGDLGENLTTQGIDLLGLPAGARLRIGSTAVIELTGLRNPCRQIDENIGRGAMAATLARGQDGTLIRKAGVMAVVIEAGEVIPGDPVEVVDMPSQWRRLEPV